MRTRLAVAAAAVAALTALTGTATAQAAAPSKPPVTAADWVGHSGPYGSLGECEFMRDYHGYNSTNAYCNQIFMGRWYLIVWE